MTDDHKGMLKVLCIWRYQAEMVAGDLLEHGDTNAGKMLDTVIPAVDDLWGDRYGTEYYQTLEDLISEHEQKIADARETIPTIDADNDNGDVS